MDNQGIVTETKKNKKHWILGHPIIWCLITLPFANIASMVLGSAFGSVFTSIVGQSDFSEFISMLIQMIFYVAISLAFVMAGRVGYGEDEFALGLNKSNLKWSMLLCLTGMPVVLLNVVPSTIEGIDHVSGLWPLLTILTHAVGVGFAEELCCRNFVMENAMQKWHDKRHAITLVLIASAVSFGALHLINLAENTMHWQMVLVQVFAAAGIGACLGAIYLRTRNLWGPVAIHALIDVTSFYFNGAGQDTGLDLESGIVYLVLTLVMIGLGVFMLRPSKLPEVKKLWGIGDATLEAVE